MKSHFFAYLSKMKYINRWGLMRNTRQENIQEHSHQVAIIAHALAVIKNKLFGANLDAERIMALAAYHEAGEVITGDLATPIKYFNPDIKEAYKKIEHVAERKLLEMLPVEFKEYYESLVHQGDDENHRIVKAADKICAFLKCVEELKAGNEEFRKASSSIRTQIDAMGMPEVDYFMQVFVPSFSLTLDELN